MLVDLSHTIERGMPSYPGLPEPRFLTWFTHAESLERGSYAPGVSFQIATYEMGGNTGTYIDAPFHRHPEADDLAALPLAKTVNLPGVLIKVGEGPIGPEAVAAHDLAGKAVLFYSGWDKRWGEADYFTSGPFITAEGCHALAQAGATLVGIDCANIDDMADKSRPAHTILLAAGIPIVEHLCGLEQLPSRGFRFFAAPPPIKGGTSFTVRAFAIVE